MTRQRRSSILAAARYAAAQGNHEQARLLFATLDISYIDHLAHSRQVDREKRESAEQAAYLMHQLEIA